MSTRTITAVFAVFSVVSGCAEPQPPANPCSTPADCPPTGNPCLEQFCDFGACTTAPVAKGISTPNQVAGDCSRVECDGDGQTMAIADDTDLPADSNSCTTDVCMNHQPKNVPVAVGTTCSENGGAVCDPNGMCVACVVANDCAGEDTTCAFRVCENATCSIGYAPNGTPDADQVNGDCASIVCDGAGGTMTVIDDLDLPDDNNACTADACMNGAGQNSNTPVDSVCNQNGGKFCDGNGTCVQCNVGAQCTSGICVSGTCRPATCDDGLENGTESDVDCGGDCPLCSAGDDCVSGADCSSGVCQSLSCGPPVVMATIPADGTTKVPVNSDFSVVFTGAMMPATLVGQTSSGVCQGSIQLSTDNFLTCLGFSSASPVMTSNNSIATFTPSPALSYGSTYFVRVTTMAQGVDGSVLGAPYKSPMGFATDTPPGVSCNRTVVISQIYGGGGSSGSSYKNDFVELHNRGTASVSLSGWSVQYAGSTGTTWLTTNLSGSIAAGGYYLVRGAGGSSGAALPTPEATGTINMSAGAGKVALVNSTTPLTKACPTSATIVDFVGFGSTTCHEGADAAPGGSNTTSISRADFGCTDSDDNAADFTEGTVAPKNKTSPVKACSCGAVGTANESGLPGEIDLCSIQAPSSIEAAPSATTPPIYGRVFETGVTEAAGANAMMMVQIGYGPPNINPTTQSGWMFFPATFHMQAGASDDYQGTFTAPMTIGSYRYAVRASLDGNSWTYCDVNGAGSSAGATFEITQLPILEVTP